MRNPSPPPLTEEEKSILNADYIDDTLYSKKWILTKLMQLHQLPDNEIYIKEKENKLDDEQQEYNDVGELELREKFENEICELWDVSGNTDVALFIHEHEGKEILLKVLEKCLSPRLMEMTFGILGNLVFVEKICVELCTNKEVQDTLLCYLTVTDTLSLVQLSRLLLVCVSNKHCMQNWIASLCLHSKIFVYILKNTLNVELVSNIVEIISIVSENNTRFLKTCIADDIVGAIQEAYAILQNENIDKIPSALYILQLVSTEVEGTVVISKDEHIKQFLCDVLHNNMEHVSESMQHDLFNSSLYSVLHCLFQMNVEAMSSYFYEHVFIVRHLIRVIINCVDDDDGILQTNELYVSVYVEILLDLLKNECKNTENCNLKITECVLDERLLRALKILKEINLPEDIKKNVLDVSSIIKTLN